MVDRSIFFWTFFAIQVILASFLIQPFILLVVYLVKSLWKDKRKKGSIPGTSSAGTSITGTQKNYQFGVVITAHQETTFIPPIIDSLLRQSYPFFNIYIVADDCDTSSLHFDDPRVHLLNPPVIFNCNSRSIAYGLTHFEEKDEILVIFDPDNLVHPEFLTVLNGYYNKGFQAVQGNLQSKNRLNVYEKIDSIGVIFNNFIDRETRSALGYSVNILGCGISVEKNIYQKINYNGLSRTGGFDKHMQVEIARNVRRIAYAEEAILYDEKISDSENLERQRTRWIGSYFKFLGEAFRLSWEAVKRRDFNLLYFAYNLVRPPYFLQIILALVFISINFLLPVNLFIQWVIALSVFLFSFLIIVIVRTSDRTLSKAIWYMPLFFYHQIRSLFKLKMNKNSILKTQHSRIMYIDDLLAPRQP